MLTRALVLVFLVVCIRDMDGEVIEIPTSASGVDEMSEYIIFTHSQSWNTARLVCQSIGANLARIDTVTMLQQLETESNNAWSAHWDHVWTGLHRATDQSLVFDDGLCSPYTGGVEIFKDTTHMQFEATKQCYMVQKDSYILERHDCSTRKNFLCERKSGTCPYNTLGTSPSIVFQTNATAISCQSACNILSGCYLAGNYFNSHCVLLTVPAGSDVMSEKMCYSASANESNTDAYRASDDTFSAPSTCTPPTDPPVVSSSVQSQLVSTASIDLCPSSSISYAYSSQECSTEILVTPSVVNVTVTETEISTVTSTETATAIFTESATITLTLQLTPSVNYITATATETSTATSTITSTEIQTTCVTSMTSAVDSPCVTNTQILTTQMLSTVVLTTIKDCPSSDLSYLTITQSCPDGSVQIQATTVTFYQETSCTCESLSLTSEPSGVVSPESASSLSSELQTAGSTTDHPFQTTICRAFNLTAVEPSVLDVLVQSIVKELTVETKNLSKTIRKKTSAQDSRTSSKSIGFTAVALTFLPLVIILFFDIPSIAKDFRNSFLSIKHKGTP